MASSLQSCHLVGGNSFLFAVDGSKVLVLCSERSRGLDLLGCLVLQWYEESCTCRRKKDIIFTFFHILDKFVCLANL